MSLPLVAVEQLVLPINQTFCVVIRDMGVLGEERSISPHTLPCGTCGEKISAVRKTQARENSEGPKKGLHFAMVTYAVSIVRFLVELPHWGEL